MPESFVVSPVAAALAGALLTAALVLVLVLVRGVSARRAARHAAGAGGDAGALDPATDPAAAGPAAAGPAAAPAVKKTVLDYIDERTIMLDVDETDRDSMIRTLTGLMRSTGRIQDEAAVARAAFTRETHGTSGIGDGIAVAHAKTDAVTSPVLAFARSRHGIDWKSPDGEAATLIFMIAVPKTSAGTELARVLAQFSRALTKPVFRSAIACAQTPADVLDALRSCTASWSPRSPLSSRPTT